MGVCPVLEPLQRYLVTHLERASGRVDGAVERVQRTHAVGDGVDVVGAQLAQRLLRDYALDGRHRLLVAAEALHDCGEPPSDAVQHVCSFT